jgi:hypothetical protein
MKQSMDTTVRSIVIALTCVWCFGIGIYFGNKNSGKDDLLEKIKAKDVIIEEKDNKIDRLENTIQTLSMTLSSHYSNHEYKKESQYTSDTLGFFFESQYAKSYINKDKWYYKGKPVDIDTFFKNATRCSAMYKSITNDTIIWQKIKKVN